MKSIKFTVFLLLMSYCLSAQIIKVQETRVAGKGGEEKSIQSVYFVDTVTHKVFDSLDLSELNPYNHLPYKVISVDKQNNKVYEINSFNDYDYLFPKKYREQYFDEYYVDSTENYEGLLTSIATLSTFDTSCRYLAIGFSLSSYSKYDDNPNGNIGMVFIYDANKKLIMRREGHPVNLLAVSGDGRYLVCTFGVMGPDVLLMHSGIEVIETVTNNAIFRVNGNCTRPLSGPFADMMEFSIEYDYGFCRDYYFDTQLKKMYSSYYNNNQRRGVLVGITGRGLLFKSENNKQYILEFGKDVEVADIK